MYSLYPHQERAVSRLKSGSILHGEVGSGKTLAALIFYQRNYPDKKLYVITTAKKRDSQDWQKDSEELGIKTEVNSWNNVKKYVDIENSFFIFDEQRAIGYSTWGRSFIKIAKNNLWIMLSATPGDVWMDYMPVFVANGFYKNKTDFVRQHVEYDRFSKHPKIKAYHNEGRLLKFRNMLLVGMPVVRETERHRQTIYSDFDESEYGLIRDKRWNPFENKPIENPSELLQCLRKSVASHPDRIFNATVLMDIHDRLIVFYNYNYELDILKSIADSLGKEYFQWNGHRHEYIPDQEKWLYFVQYTAGSEGWNCISTNVMMFYSLNYSYRMMEQAEGRIDRLNTKFKDLEYYTLMSRSKIEKDIYRTVINKKNFNGMTWARKEGVAF